MSEDKTRVQEKKEYRGCIGKEINEIFRIK